MQAREAGSSVGSYLRALREESKGVLEDIARATRVSLGQLEAMESDNFAELPAPVFVKGFIRAYCAFLGEPPDEALDRYRNALGEQPSTERAAPARRRAPSWSASPVFISLALLVVFGGGLLALKGLTRGRGPVAPPVASVVVEPGASVVVKPGASVVVKPG